MGGDKVVTRKYMFDFVSLKMTFDRLLFFDFSARDMDLDSLDIVGQFVIVVIIHLHFFP